MINTEYITLVKYVLIRNRLNTIKLIEIKRLQDLNYIKGTQCS